VAQTAAMLDCLVTIKATMNVLQKCKDEIADSLNKTDKITSLIQRFSRVVVDVLKNGKTESFIQNSGRDFSPRSVSNQDYMQPVYRAAVRPLRQRNGFIHT
jgi:hypothetical protein